MLLFASSPALESRSKFCWQHYLIGHLLPEIAYQPWRLQTGRETGAAAMSKWSCVLIWWIKKYLSLYGSNSFKWKEALMVAWLDRLAKPTETAKDHNRSHYVWLTGHLCKNTTAFSTEREMSISLCKWVPTLTWLCLMVSNWNVKHTWSGEFNQATPIRLFFTAHWPEQITETYSQCKSLAFCSVQCINCSCVWNRSLIHSVTIPYIVFII